MNSLTQGSNIICNRADRQHSEEEKEDQSTQKVKKNTLFNGTVQNIVQFWGVDLFFKQQFFCKQTKEEWNLSAIFAFLACMCVCTCMMSMTHIGLFVTHKCASDMQNGWRMHQICNYISSTHQNFGQCVTANGVLKKRVQKLPYIAGNGSLGVSVVLASFSCEVLNSRITTHHHLQDVHVLRFVAFYVILWKFLVTPWKKGDKVSTLTLTF